MLSSCTPTFNVWVKGEPNDLSSARSCDRSREQNRDRSPAVTVRRFYGTWASNIWASVIWANTRSVTATEGVPVWVNLSEYHFKDYQKQWVKMSVQPISASITRLSTGDHFSENNYGNPSKKEGFSTSINKVSSVQQLSWEPILQTLGVGNVITCINVLLTGAFQDDSTGGGCKVTPDYLGFSWKLVHRVVLCSKAESESLWSVRSTA